MMGMGQRTTWLKFDLVFEDRITGEVRTHKDVLMEVVVVTQSNEILFQDIASGTHRVLPIDNIKELVKS